MTTELDKNKTFLLNDVEVCYTGRVATRILKNKKEDIRLEVKPRDPEDGSRTKWVRSAELYEINTATE